MRELIGVDIGGTKCLVAGVTTEGRWRVCEPVPTGAPEATLSALMAGIESLGVGDNPVFGVACGGPLDARAGVIQSPPNLPGWDDVRVTEILTARFGGEALLMNDADAAALAEWRFGAGKGTRSMVFPIPEMIVIGSLYVRAREWLETPMRAALAEEALPGSVSACRVVPAALGERLPAHQSVAVAAYSKGIIEDILCQ